MHAIARYAELRGQRTPAFSSSIRQRSSCRQTAQRGWDIFAMTVLQITCGQHVRRTVEQQAILYVGTDVARRYRMKGLKNMCVRRTYSPPCGGSPAERSRHMPSKST
jgi:hypothetical protein